MKGWKIQKKGHSNVNLKRIIKCGSKGTPKQKEWKAHEDILRLCHNFLQCVYTMTSGATSFLLLLLFEWTDTTFSSGELLSCVWLFATPRTAACQASLSITNSWSLLILMSVGDAIQPSHPLSSHSPPAPHPSQHQGLFKWVSSLHQVAKLLELQLQHQSFQRIFRTDFL